MLVVAVAVNTCVVVVVVVSVKVDDCVAVELLVSEIVLVVG